MRTRGEKVIFNEQEKNDELSNEKTNEIYCTLIKPGKIKGKCGLNNQHKLQVQSKME